MDQSSSESLISVILPVWNEAETIVDTLLRLEARSEIEVIVVDGGSQDGTLEVLRSQADCAPKGLNLQVLSSPLGRACQMNTGASVATGEILLFLHADTRLPANFDIFVQQSLKQPKTVAGAFELRIDNNLLGLRLIEKMVSLRSRLLSLPYGDQAIFLKRDIFEKIGGFPDLPIMEDFELMRRLKPWGRINIVSVAVITSARRWQKLGIIKTTLINQLVIIGYFLGVPPAQLVRWYRGKS